MKDFSYRRKSAWIILVVLIVLAAASCHSVSDPAAPCLVDKDSWLQDFQIADGSVIFFCHLTINNPGDRERTVSITGHFTRDAEAGLITEDTLQAVLADDSRVTRFSVQPGLTQLDVAFIGTHGSCDVKQDRLLPAIEILARTDRMIPALLAAYGFEEKICQFVLIEKSSICGS